MSDHEPATDRQKKKLHWLGITVRKGLTKDEASRLLDEAEAADPAREEAYQIAKERDEDAGLLAELVNDEDAREMGEYKKLTQAQALQLRDYFAARRVNWGEVDHSQMAGVIRQLFPDRIVQPRNPQPARAACPKAGGCLLFLAGVLVWLTIRLVC